MQPLKIVIEGSYYDTQIYSGRLYLWCDDGSIRIIDWDRLLDSISVKQNLRLALKCGFQRSDYLYGNRWDLIFDDQEVRNLIINKFLEQGERPIIIPENLLLSTEIKHQENPIPFPHSDLLIYYQKLYVASPEGIFSTSCSKKNRYPVSRRMSKLWDAPVLGISASYSTLSLFRQ